MYLVSWFVNCVCSRCLCICNGWVIVIRLSCWMLWCRFVGLGLSVVILLVILRMVCCLVSCLFVLVMVFWLFRSSLSSCVRWVSRMLVG